MYKVGDKVAYTVFNSKNQKTTKEMGTIESVFKDACAILPMKPSKIEDTSEGKMEIRVTYMAPMCQIEKLTSLAEAIYWE